MPLLVTAASDYKLTDFLSSAGATIGIIIAGTIFLQFLSSKYVELSGRYRELAAEYRGVSSEHGRHAPLRSQIRCYRRRLKLLNRASDLGAVALLCFLAAAIAGAMSVLYPPVLLIRAVGTGGLLMGLSLISAAVAVELRENVMARQEIVDEIADLDDEARSTSC